MRAQTKELQIDDGGSDRGECERGGERRGERGECDRGGERRKERGGERGGCGHGLRRPSSGLDTETAAEATEVEGGAPKPPRSEVLCRKGRGAALAVALGRVSGLEDCCGVHLVTLCLP